MDPGPRGSRSTLQEHAHTGSGKWLPPLEESDSITSPQGCLALISLPICQPCNENRCHSPALLLGWFLWDENNYHQLLEALLNFQGLPLCSLSAPSQRVPSTALLTPHGPAGQGLRSQPCLTLAPELLSGTREGKQ